MGEDFTTAMQMLPELATYSHGIGPTQELIFEPGFMALAKDLEL
jgi:hypothetical protein